jgi:hypothetical protein
MDVLSKKSEDGLMTWEQLLALAKVHDKDCVSIYIPTERAGESVDSGEGQLRLKNSLKEVKNILNEEGRSENEKKAILDPVEALLDNLQFWRNQSDGLAIFAKKDDMHVFTLPVSFNERIYVRDHYYLLPVMPYFNDDGVFYLLSLGMQHVHLYECSRHFIEEILVDDLTPGRLEDVVGYDFEQKSLQHRSGQEGENRAMFHGHGAGKDDKAIEKEKFFRAVDAGVIQVLNGEKAPLVLACVNEYYPIYKKVTKYGNLFDTHISGNPDESEPLQLHEEGWLLVEDHFMQERKQKMKLLQDESAGAKASTDLREIVPAAIDGRIDTLFIEEGKDLYGIYDMQKRQVELAEPDDRLYHASLNNLAAVETILKGGRVFLAPTEEMPVQAAELNTLLRY